MRNPLQLRFSRTSRPCLDFSDRLKEAVVVRGTCGTGGRYVREAGTAHDSEGVPYYCVHCPIWWEEMPKEFGINLTFQMGDQGVGCAWRLQR